MSSETNPLLESNKRSTSSRTLICCKPKHICLQSKAAVLVILWTAVLGLTYNLFRDGAAFLIGGSKYSHKVDIAVLDLIPYVSLVVIMTFYPLSGFIADVCCGRFKMIMTSVSLMLLSLTFFSITCIIAIHTTASFSSKLRIESYIIDQGEGIAFLILLVVTLVCFIVGLIGYHANYIQFGLDQLLEAPSEYLALFIHYAMWAFSFSTIVDISLFSLISCRSTRRTFFFSIFIAVPSLLMISSLVLYIISCLKRRDWFYVEPGQHNPYVTVFGVVNFARKHNHPLLRSAFTYCDDYIPTRLDFAKERYGGPFTTEEVESVKTLFRILLLLVVMGPVHVLQVPPSQYIFPFFGFHTGNNEIHTVVTNCSADHVIALAIKSGALTASITNILFPVYIWIVFSALRRNPPKMFTRLGIGIILSLFGVLTMIIIDMVGHSMNNKSQCMFQITKQNYTLEYQPLHMHWSVLIAPSVFFGIGPLLITTTSLEFISAQSPHSMKGLLVGVYFTIQGFFKLFGIVAVLPVSLTQPWTQELPSVISCGSVYLFLILMTGLLGFALFIISAKRYNYRERDDINFYQRDIEEIYTRYLLQAPTATENICD